MKSMKKILFLLLLSCCVLSCSQYPKLTTRNIDKGHKKTNALITDLAQKGKKVFSIKSTYSTESLVWIHDSDKLTLYLVDSKGVDKKEFLFGYELVLDPLGSFDGSDHLYPYALDGDIISFSQLGNTNQVESKSIPVNIALFIETDFPKEYLLANQFKKDILFIYSALGKDISK